MAWARPAASRFPDALPFFWLRHMGLCGMSGVAVAGCKRSGCAVALGAAAAAAHCCADGAALLGAQKLPGAPAPKLVDPRNDLPDIVDALFNGTPAERKAVCAVLYAEDAVLWNSMYTCAPLALLGA